MRRSSAVLEIHVIPTGVTVSRLGLTSRLPAEAITPGALSTLSTHKLSTSGDNGDAALDYGDNWAVEAGPTEE